MLRPTSTQATRARSGPSTINSPYHQLPSPSLHQSLDKSVERECHFGYRHRTTESGSRTMKKYNVGIVGYGWVATAHIPAINASPLGQVTAVCSSRKLDAAALSAQYGSPIRGYNDLDEMLAN